MTSVIRTPRGESITCKGWGQEAALRMLMNNLDPEVAEVPELLVVYGGMGKAARNWECFHKIVESLRSLENDETLVVQSGKPVGIFRTHSDAPRVLIANSNLVGAWSTFDEFRRLEAMGLTMYGQMTAGSWIYIGTQGILQGTFQTLAALAERHFGGSLKGRLVVSAGLGGMGGAQPLATKMNEGVFLGVEIDPQRIQRRLETKYLDRECQSLDEAVKLALEARRKDESLTIGLVGNIAEVLPELLERDVIPDVLTDQTSAHDPLNGYIPAELSLEDAAELRARDPETYIRKSRESMASHVSSMIEMQKRGAIVFDYGNNLRGQAKEAGIQNAFDYPGFVPAYIRPLFFEGKGPFRWVALSGEPNDILRTDEALLETFPKNQALHRWLTMAREHVKFQGLPARICWLGYGEREKAGVIFNELVRKGHVKAPIVIGRDHFDSGSVASPNRETEGMRDGSDAIADWPILNALLNSVAGATWVSVHNGGGVGIGQSLHAGMVVVADGSNEAEERLRRVLSIDPGTGIMRHADAGYPEAREMALKHNIKIPML